jgi:hypothetical protein
MASVVSWLGWVVMGGVGATSRLNVHRSAGFRAREQAGLPVIFAFWHRYQLMGLYEHRGRGVHALVSRSRDGEMIARALHRFGYRTVRGSSSRGGGAALAQLLDIVNAGDSVAFTPDGPRGPFRSIQPGVLAVASRTGAPIVPMAWAGSRVKELKSWDKFLIPLPFGRYEMVFGEPLFLNTADAAAEAKLREALDAVEAEARARLAG